MLWMVLNIHSLAAINILSAEKHKLARHLVKRPTNLTSEADVRRIGADYHRATARREKLIIGCHPVRNWTQV